MIALLISRELSSGLHAYLPDAKLSAVSVSEPGGVLTLKVAAVETEKSLSEVGDPVPES